MTKNVLDMQGRENFSTFFPLKIYAISPFPAHNFTTGL